MPTDPRRRQDAASASGTALEELPVRTAALVTGHAIEQMREPTSNGVPWLMYLVKRVELAQRASLDDVLREHGLTLAQYTALNLLQIEPDLSSAQLARRLYVSPQAMNQLVALLEREGVIKRRADPSNRRIMRARVTAHGEAVLKRCNVAVAELEETLLAGMLAEQVAELRAALERFLGALPRPSRRTS